MFMTAWLDAIGTHSRYFVGSVDQNAMHVVASAMYGSHLMAPVSDIDNCDYFLLVGANPAVSAWNWVETVPGGWKRTPGPAEGRARTRRRRPGADRVRGAGRRPSGGAARTGLGAVAGLVKVILDEGLEHAEDCRDLATGVPALRELVADADLDDLAARCDVSSAQIDAGRAGFRRRHVRAMVDHPHRNLTAPRGHDR